MEIKPYKQSLTHSCLTTSFLMLLQENSNLNFTKRDEQKISLLGSRRIYPFYMSGISIEIAKKYKTKIKIVVDNKFFANVLSKSFDLQKEILVEARPINIKLIRNLLEKHKLICHVDVHGLGENVHSSHFIVIEKVTKDTFTIIDPWYGKRKRISSKTLETSILELKKHIKMCPLLFYL